MNFAGLLFLVALHLLCGWGLLRLFRIGLPLFMSLSLALPLGIAVSSLAPLALELLHIPLTRQSCAVALVFLCSLPLLCSLFHGVRWQWKPPAIHVHASEWPFIIVIAFLLALSLWQSFYFPVVARDMLSGPETIAEYAVREKTLINSVYTRVNLETTNNHLKSPYVTSLQLLYKLYVQPFGQMWVSLIAIGFTGFLYQMLRNSLHPFFAGIFSLFFLITPEIYGYTYMMLYDYSNMAFFFLGCYFLHAWLEHRQLRLLLFSSFLFGLATYIRSETLVLVLLLCPGVLYSLLRHKTKVFSAIGSLALLPLGALLFYLVCIELYVKHYLPVHFHVGQELNRHLGNLDPLWRRFSEMNSRFIFSSSSIPFWGFTLYLFLLLPLVDLIWHRRLQPGARFWLYTVLVVYLGLPLLGYLLPLMDLMNTTKRGLFKLFPLLLAALQYNTLLQRWSAQLHNWSLRKPVPAPVRPQRRPPSPSPSQGKSGKRRQA